LPIFFNGKYIIIKNQISAQDEQKSIKDELQNKGAVYKRNINENTKTYFCQIKLKQIKKIYPPHDSLPEFLCKAKKIRKTHFPCFPPYWILVRRAHYPFYHSAT
jgi:hypothetical protein